MENNKVTIEWEVRPDQTLETYIVKSVQATLSWEEIHFPCEVEVLIVNGETIRQLNHEYRGIDRETDVLSFPMYENKEQAASDFFEDIPVMLGNMVLCLDKAKQQAEEYGHSYERELHYLIVHGIMHCLGYDHMVEDEKAEMREKEEYIL